MAEEFLLVQNEGFLSLFLLQMTLYTIYKVQKWALCIYTVIKIQPNPHSHNKTPETIQNHFQYKMGSLPQNVYFHDETT